MIPKWKRDPAFVFHFILQVRKEAEGIITFGDHG